MSRVRFSIPKLDTVSGIMLDVDMAAGIRAAINGYRQVDVAEALGVKQNTVSRWVTGTSSPRELDVLEAIEAACARPRGFILLAAGYIQLPQTTREAIAMEPRLSQERRDDLLAMYDRWVSPEPG